tara:strand:+ start:336 stop:527 length:192 start_codon:yes stop_codon:yes gene_type:complete
VAFLLPFFLEKIMSAVLYKKNDKGEIVSEWFEPSRVGHLLTQGFKSTKEEFEKKEVKKQSAKK